MHCLLYGHTEGGGAGGPAVARKPLQPSLHTGGRHMIDCTTLQEILVGYKADCIVTTEPLEEHKWRALRR